MAIVCVVDDVHLINSTASGFTQSTDPYSIAVWINGNWNSGSVYSFVGLYGPSPTPTTALQIGSRGAGLVSCWTWGGGILVASPTTVTSNVWHHVVYTYDGTTHKLYIDGDQVNTATTAQLAGQFSMVCINGYPTGGTNETSTHQVDSYAYYNRMLSADEVLTMYNAQGARHGIVDGLVAAYEFDELLQGSTVASVTDLSGNGNNLTVNGAGSALITYTYAGTAASSNLRRVH